MRTTSTTIGNVLTRTSGYLRGVTSHSLQPYRGCPWGRALCGVGCYVQHNYYVTRGQPWGTFLEVRTNAAVSYAAHFEKEQRWARKYCKAFGVFFSSSTEPFPPQEDRLGISRAVLETMRRQPPDRLIVQTHSDRVLDQEKTLVALATETDLRVHISIETDLESIPGLPPHASSVAARFAAAERLKQAGLFVVITVSPLLPIRDPPGFFERIATSADAVVLDHFIGGDGSADGSRTRRTPLVGAIEAVERDAAKIEYRDAMIELAQRCLPGHVGVGADGFAGRYLP